MATPDRDRLPPRGQTSESDAEDEHVPGLPRPKVWLFPRLLTEHVFDKLWLLDMTLGEFQELLDEPAEVIEEFVIGDGSLKELVLSLHWSEPLHIVVVVDEHHQEERLVTVYEPAAESWSDNFRVRR